MKQIVIAVALVTLCCSSVEARWRLSRRPARCSTASCQPVQAPTQAPIQKQTQAPTQKLTDQAACQQKAGLLARRGVLSHGVAPIIGRFEGIGYGSSPSCNTCVPSRGMTLTGDAAARGANGMWYRVRSWR